MSKTLSSVAVTEFDSMVKQAYQNKGLIKPHVTVRNNVVGDTYKFRRMLKGLANQKSTSDLVTPMDVGHEFKTATLANWNAPEYTDIFDQAEVNFDEKQELADVVAGAIAIGACKVRHRFYTYCIDCPIVVGVLHELSIWKGIITVIDTIAIRIGVCGVEPEPCLIHIRQAVVVSVQGWTITLRNVNGLLVGALL